MGSEKSKGNSDQSRFSRGIRNLDNRPGGDGKFIEFEQNPNARRDPEESRYDEAGKPVTTQGDKEMSQIETKVLSLGS